MHCYWKSRRWCPLTGHPQREDSQETRSCCSISAPSFSLSSLPTGLCCNTTPFYDVPESWKMGVLRHVSRCFPKPSCLWDREAIPRANLLWTRGGPVSRCDGKLHPVGVSALYCWANSMVGHWPWPWNEPQEGHYLFLSQFRPLGHKMGEPKVKNACYQVGRKDRYRDEVQRKWRAWGTRGTLSNAASFKIMRPSSSC